MQFKDLNALLNKRSCGGKKGSLPVLKQTAKKLGLLPLIYKSVLIAGTNGKGTSAFLLSEAAIKSGFKTGLFISPHLYDIRERITVNGKKISKKDFCKCLEEVLSAEVKPLKFFELLTLTALVYFKLKKVEAAVFECGIGGLKDSTNIINADLSIITCVAKDHEQLLGKSVKEIAFQKAGIIKTKKPCVLGQVSPEVLKIIEAICKKKKAALFRPKAQKIKLDFNKNKTFFEYKNKKYSLNMLGQKQAQNAALVILASNILGFDKGIKKALLEDFLPGRFEVRKLNKNYLVQDGAHNPCALKEFLEVYKKSPYFKKENILIYGVNRDKDYKTCIKLLNPYFKKACLVEFENSCKKEELKKYFKKCTFLELPTLTRTKASIVQAGSFYLFNKVKKYLPLTQPRY